jgi:hypothetical protein
MLRDEFALARTVLHVTTVHRADDTRIYRRQVLSLADRGFSVVLAAVDAEEILRPERVRADDLEIRTVSLRGHQSRLLRILDAPLQAM